MTKPSPRDETRGGPTPRTDSSAQDKVFPPDSPVDVPNLPGPAPAGGVEEARDASKPAEDTNADSDWADTTQPAPDKKRVRNSNIF